MFHIQGQGKRVVKGILPGEQRNDKKTAEKILEKEKRGKMKIWVLIVLGLTYFFLIYTTFLYFMLRGGG